MGIFSQREHTRTSGKRRAFTALMAGAIALMPAFVGTSAFAAEDEATPDARTWAVILRHNGNLTGEVGPNRVYEVGWVVENSDRRPVVLTQVAVDFQTPGNEECSSGEYIPEILDSPEVLSEPLIVLPHSEMPDSEAPGAMPFFNAGFRTPDWNGKDCQRIDVDVPITTDVQYVNLVGATSLDGARGADRTLFYGSDQGSLVVDWSATAEGVDLPAPAGETEFFIDGESVGTFPIENGRSVFELGDGMGAGAHEFTAQLVSENYGSASDEEAEPFFTSEVQQFFIAEEPTSSLSLGEPGVPVDGFAADGQQAFTVRWQRAADDMPALAGDVQFLVDGNPIGGPVRLAEGEATLNLNELVDQGIIASLLEEGSYTLTAVLQDELYGELVSDELPFDVSAAAQEEQPESPGEEPTGKDDGAVEPAQPTAATETRGEQTGVAATGSDQSLLVGLGALILTGGAAIYLRGRRSRARL